MRTKKKSSYAAAIAALVIVGVVGASACGKSAEAVCKSTCAKAVECVAEIMKSSGMEVPEEAMKQAKEKAAENEKECNKKCVDAADGGRATAEQAKKIDECNAKPCSEYAACLKTLKD